METYRNHIKIKSKNLRVLVTGATGYIGGRLIPRLLEKDIRVRVLVRDPDKIKNKAWYKNVEVFKGDLTNLESIKNLSEGIDQAFYLIHSMAHSEDYIRLDRLAALNFISVSKNIQHVIYLGGISPKDGKNISNHLKSRIEVGNLLSSALPTTEFRAGPIIGSGSASFEMLRHLCEKLPIMIAPKWIHNYVRPVSIRDVLKYLVLAIDKLPLKKIDIGTEPMTFKDMMLQYCKYRNLKRIIITVPILAPGLAARWVGLVTPITNLLAVPIVKGIVNNLLGDTSLSRSMFPEVSVLNYKDSMKSAFNKTKSEYVETSWNQHDIKPGYSFFEHKGRFEEVRINEVKSTPDNLFKVFKSLGGSNGWLAFNPLWTIRKIIDRILGGKMLEEPKRENIEEGDLFDCFQIEKYEEGRKMLMKIILKTPGNAWLKLEAVPQNDKTFLVLSAIFEPKGFWGYVYWYSIFPLHKLIFDELIRKLVLKAEHT
ncbi:MAG: DUF2867 domain-containing protein [Thermodesulfobacteriota bacterium]|nr:DUF2867 domain-containing protein [Thermodesulfobacteriota bacterium]|tara:strand:+ start:44663 stop:46108 length:1446 start_codon:yes stop_codon:yes gene_type:complete